MPETYSTDSQACLLKCIVILNDKDITLNAYERTELTISDVKIGTFDAMQLVFQVKHHLTDAIKYWCVIDNFIYTQNSTKPITITILAQETCTIKANEPICHVQLYSVSEVITNLRGNNFNVYLNY
jgi:hypothetical protein